MLSVDKKLILIIIVMCGLKNISQHLKHCLNAKQTNIILPNMMCLGRLIAEKLLLMVLLLFLLQLMLTFLDGSLFGYAVIANNLLEHLNL